MKPLATFLTLSVLMLSFFAFSQTPSAHAASTSQSDRHIDLSHAVPDLRHPVAMDYPCPGQPHSVVGSGSVNKPAVSHSCTTVKQGIHPFLSSGPNCSSGPYLLTVSGQSTWYTSNASANVGSWVQYYYCPSPGYLHGLNWSTGREYPLSGCSNLGTGSGWGANMQSSTGIIESDGENWQVRKICTGNWVQDWSQAGDGSLNWQVWMYGNSTGGSCRAQSPTYA